jgi:hypothetical protein
MHTRVTMLTDHARRCSRAGASVADAYTQGIRPQVRAGTGRGASASSSCGTRTLAGRRCRTCSTRSRCPPARAGDAGIRRVPARRGSRTNGTAIMSGCTHSRSALPSSCPCGPRRHVGCSPSSTSTSRTCRLAGSMTINEVAGSDIDHTDRYGLLSRAPDGSGGDRWRCVLRPATQRADDLVTMVAHVEVLGDVDAAAVEERGGWPAIPLPLSPLQSAVRPRCPFRSPRVSCERSPIRALGGHLKRPPLSAGRRELRNMLRSGMDHSWSYAWQYDRRRWP